MLLFINASLGSLLQYEQAAPLAFVLFVSLSLSNLFFI